MSGSGSVTGAVPLAHSPRNGVGAQPYCIHVTNVRNRAMENVTAALTYFSGDSQRKEEFKENVSAAVNYHDIGKMDEENQNILRISSKKGLPVPHEDAGVAALLALGRETSAHLVFAHHAGLVEKVAAQVKYDERYLRNFGEIASLKQAVIERTDALLDTYLKRHHDEAGMPLLTSGNLPLRENGFALRLALSCLVDGDHGDTANHYGNEPATQRVQTRWAERLAALDHYVANLKSTSTRDTLRRRVYEACRNAEISDPLRSCEAPVGSGKTTAIMAHQLQVAQIRQLRHIIVVLPYTNIIKQSVDIYRKALVLPGENPYEVVAEHHHLADYSSIELRHLTMLWQAPIIVTTAVQFFETLASYHPARLRKLHELPGSAAFIDEVHAAIPTKLWPQVWRWLHDWTSEWGGYAVFASGSLPRFWDLSEMSELIQSGGKIKIPYPVPSARELLPDHLRQELNNEDKKRIQIRRCPEPFRLEGLIEFVQSKPGPRLVIMNTVQSAAIVAKTMKEKGLRVLHLSTALAPIDRDSIIERVHEWLANSDETDWTLVATSCVEAGMNFSFRTGFRERSSTASLIQTTGRVSRGAEFNGAEVWDFQTDDEQLTQNPALESSRIALYQLLEKNLPNTLPPGDLALEAMKRELMSGGDLERAEKLQKEEKSRNYHSVTEQARVIASDTRTVIISEPLSARIGGGDKVSSREIQRHSVQIWFSKIDIGKLPIALLKGNHGEYDALYQWTGEYDSNFLGYMEGALKYVDVLKQGAIIA